MITKRLKIHIATIEEMETIIDSEKNEEMRIAYTEMLSGAKQHPEQYDWYAIWMIDLSDGRHVGDLCFKGLNSDGSSEIGYGISEIFQNQGYATEAVNAAVDWAFKQNNVTMIYAETEPNNIASQRVLAKCGFHPTGKIGKEGPIFEKTNDVNRENK